MARQLKIYMSKDQFERLVAKVDNILFETWDPIGVGGSPDASDEYTPYARKIACMLIERRDAFAIAKYLRQLESGMLALPAKEKRIKKVVRLILEKCGNES